MKAVQLFIALIISSALTTAKAQTGGDGCLMLDPLFGQGSFAFDGSAATTGLALIDSCSSTIDTKIAIYPGTGCPTQGTALGCNDTSCSYQARVVAPLVIAGAAYTVQLGTFPGSAGGAGTMQITVFPSYSNDGCATPDVIVGQGTFNYFASSATTGLEGQGEALCYSLGSSAVDNDVWFSWTAGSTGVATLSTCVGGGVDSKIAAYPGGACPTAGTSLACNDDACNSQSEITFSVVSGVDYMLQIGSSPGAAGGNGLFTLSIGAAEPGVAYCFCDAGNSPCNNGGLAGHGCANGSGASGAKLSGSGLAIVGSDTLVLSASGLVPSQPGLYFQGNGSVNGGLGIIFGDGLRCAGGSVVRLGVAVADASGNSDTSGLALPISVAGGVTTGDLRHYQLWYRDPAGSPCGAQFNLTNGYSVQW